MGANLQAERDRQRERNRFALFAALLPMAAYLFFALFFLWPLAVCPTCVPYAPGAQYSDLMISHLPNAEYWREAVFRYRQWPLWNGQLFGGQPFAADPLAGLWYPPNLLLLLLPLPLAFNVLFVLHLAGAGYGLFRFLRAQGLSLNPAFLGGLVFAGTPKLIAHIGAGHVSLVFAVAWTPWLLLLIHSARHHEETRGGMWVGAVLAFTFLADPRWAFMAGGLGLGYWLYRIVQSAQLRAAATAKAHRRRRVLEVFAGWTRGLVVAPLFFWLIGSVLIIPLFEFVTRSNRVALTLQEAGAYSLPAYYLIGLLIPNLRGFHEWMTYVGVLSLLLAVFTLQRRFIFWWVVIGAAVAFALGVNFILFPMLYAVVPGLSFLRVPARAWFIVAFGVSVLAAHGAQILMNTVWPFLKERPALQRWLPSARSVMVALVLFTAFDLFRVNVTLLEARPRPARNAAAEWIAANGPVTGFRVYSPSYSLPLDDGLQHLDGVNPLHLASTARFIEAASGVTSHGYSVTLPTFESADLATANRNAIPDARALGLLNVKYVASEFDLAVPELRLAQTFGETRVYANVAFRPRVWMEGGGKAEVLLWSPNKIVARGEGPGLLVLSEMNYPGWEVRVEGQPANLEPVHEVLMGVRLQHEGGHLVEFEFQPLAEIVGLVFFIFGCVLLIDPWLWRRQR